MSIRNSESGQTLIIASLLMTAVLGLVGLVLDVGMAFQEKSNAQNAADAAALAGVQALLEGDDLDVDAAIEEARDYAAENGIDDPDTQTIVNIPPTSGASAGDEDCVEVKVSADSTAAFARVFDIEFFSINTRAVACMEELDPFTGLMPWAVKESAIKLDGTPTVMKYDSNNGQTGNFGALRFFGNGSKNYENNIKNGVQGPVCAQSQPTCLDPTEDTEPGNMVGGTRDGTNYRLTNTIAACDAFGEVFVPNGSGGYEIVEECNPFIGAGGSLKVVLVPVVDQFCNGHCTLTLKYFALLFLNNLGTCTGNNCEVSGTFVKKVYDPTLELEFTPGVPSDAPPSIVE
ncbi:MAG: pilus assembly protein TadG-related protein [Dehalococcoidia bacterium]